MYVPAAGFATDTDSSESPSADCATCAPDASYTVRSRSAPVSEVPPIATSREAAPSGTTTVVVRVSPCASEGRSVFDEPSGPPFRVPSSAANLFVTFQEAVAGVPTFASGTLTVAGSNSAPSTVTSSL